MNNKTGFIKLTASLALGGAMFAALPQLHSAPAFAASSVEQAKKQVKQGKEKLQTKTITVSQTEARDKFNDHFDHSKRITEIKLVPRKADYVYKITGVGSKQEYQATINASTGKIISSSSEKLDLDERLQKGLNFDKLISRKQASKIAEKQVKGNSKEWVLEQDGGKAYWEVTVANGKQEKTVKINAHNKKVVDVEHDD